MRNSMEWNCLNELPSKQGRYVVLDTETTGINYSKDNIIELAAVEILNGKLSGYQMHTFLRPRKRIEVQATEKHKMGSSFYDEFYSDVYFSDKESVQNFLAFLKDSVIFAHNAIFDYNFLNSELQYWGLPTLSKLRFRCTMRIFKDIIGRLNPDFYKMSSLEKCCNYFKLKSSHSEYHTAIFDSFMCARLVCNLWETLEKNPDIYKQERPSRFNSNKSYGNENLHKPEPLYTKPKSYIKDSIAIKSISEKKIPINKVTEIKITNEMDVDDFDIDAYMLEHINHSNENNSNVPNSQVTDYGESKQVTEMADKKEEKLKNHAFLKNYQENEKQVMIFKNSQDYNLCQENISNSPETKNGKYKNMMRKYLNNYEKTKSIEKTYEKVIQNSPGEINISAEELEIILKDSSSK